MATQKPWLGVDLKIVEEIESKLGLEVSVGLFSTT